jgi:hypothetical protein
LTAPEFDARANEIKPFYEANNAPIIGKAFGSGKGSVFLALLNQRKCAEWWPG